MPKSGEKKSGHGKGIHIDDTSLKMFTRYMQERAKPAKDQMTNEELASEFAVSERTLMRKVEVVQKGMNELNLIADTLPKDLVRPKERDKTPGPLSQAVMKGKRSSPGTAVAVKGNREEYLSIQTPKTNPLDGLNEGQISQAGVAVGIVFGGGLAKMGKALSETHRPLGERAMEMAQGANATANMVLGVFEALRAFGVIGDGSQPVADGRIIDVQDDR